MGTFNAAISGVFSAKFVNSKVFSEPPVRFELTTYALRVRCSTPELRWLAAKATFTFYWNFRIQIFDSKPSSLRALPKE